MPSCTGQRNQASSCSLLSTSIPRTGPDGPFPFELLKVTINNGEVEISSISGIGDLPKIQHDAVLDVLVQRLLQPPLLQPYPILMRAWDPPNVHEVRDEVGEGRRTFSPLPPPHPRT
jgi:hypothetical protein